MSPKLAEVIEQHFSAHQEDDGGSDFCSFSEFASYRFLGDFSTSCLTIYTTKPDSVLARWDTLGSRQSIAVIGRSGLPRCDGISLLKHLLSPKCIFLGDADPPDLLVYAWLRTLFPIEWTGVSDDFLARVGTLPTNGMLIPLSTTEQKALSSIYELCPDYQNLIGPTCSKFLKTGKKLELEAAINFATIDAVNWFTA